ILRETPDEGLEFPRDDLRTQVYGRLTEARRRLLHRRAAEALEAYAPANLPTVYALARHCYLGKLDDRAVAYNRLAAEFAARSFAPLVAREHLDRAREALGRIHPRDPVAEVETALELAVQLDLLGELDAAEQLLKSTLSAVEGRPEIPPTLRAFAAVCLARIYSDQGRWEQVDRITGELFGPDATPLGPRTLLAIHRLRGEFLYFHGRYVESLREHDLAIGIARAQREDREVALETVRRANVLGMIPGRFEEAVGDYHRVIATLLERGDKGEAAYAQIYLGVVLSQHGRNEEGLEALRTAKELAEAAHDPRRLGWSMFNIADLERERGHLDIAAESNGRARELLERIGDRYGLVQTYIIEGKIRLQAGELDAAHIALLEGYRLVRELNVPADEVEVLLRLAELALARADRPQAETRLAELDRLGIERLRPDLVADYRRLRERVGPGGDDPAA
ncbi:MAG TPA: tetratricopeptide repeat protein, partial [Thermoplasmata archaeon]